MTYKLLILIFALLVIKVTSFAQFAPAEGREVHYRIIEFSCPKSSAGADATLDIAKGNYTSQADFEKNISIHQRFKGNKIIAEVPAFGAAYTWRISSGGIKAYYALHHFTTLYNPFLDTTQNRFRIINNNGQYNDAFFIVDGTRCMYNSKGLPVWYLPDIDGFINVNTQVRDIKITPQGTITLLAGENAFEITYDGKLLWYKPSTQKLRDLEIPEAHLHHEFTRFKNGHYMVLGNEIYWFKLPTPEDDHFTRINKADMLPDPGRKKYASAEFGTVLEYDKAGKLLWTWKAVDHFNVSNLYYRKLPGVMGNLDLHQNAFYFDEATRHIYVSFKPISQILKINYPKGDVVHTFGKSYTANEPGDDFFCEQHSCKRSKEGYLYVFNNNLCDSLALPSLVIMKEPANKKERLKKIWEFEVPVEAAQRNELRSLDKSHFGSVLELPDMNLFASACSPYGNVFIVNRNKEVRWHAVTEKHDSTSNKWTATPNYRASFIRSRAELNRVIGTHTN